MPSVITRNPNETMFLMDSLKQKIMSTPNIILDANTNQNYNQNYNFDNQQNNQNMIIQNDVDNFNIIKPKKKAQKRKLVNVDKNDEQHESIKKFQKLEEDLVEQIDEKLVEERFTKNNKRPKRKSYKKLGITRDQALTLRRMRGNLVEVQKRKIIGKQFKELKGLLGSNKKDQGTLLENACDRIQDLEAQIGALKEKRKLLEYKFQNNTQNYPFENNGKNNNNKKTKVVKLNKRLGGRMLKDCLMTSRVPMLQISWQGIIIGVNFAMEHYVGRSRSFLVGCHCHTLTHPQDCAKEIRERQQQKNGEKRVQDCKAPKTMTKRLMGRNGEYISAEMRIWKTTKPGTDVVSGMIVMITNSFLVPTTSLSKKINVEI